MIIENATAATQPRPPAPSPDATRRGGMIGTMTDPYGSDRPANQPGAGS